MAAVGSQRQPNTPLIGREREQAMLTACLENALSGQGRLALIAGEPGIGKTRLAEELVIEAAGEGVPAYWGHCFEWAGTPAYWPWIEILRDVVDASDAGQVREHLGANAGLVAQIVPEIVERLPETTEAPSMNPEQARFRLFDGVTRLLTGLSNERPMLLVLEDLHWADPGALLLLEFVSRELNDASLLIVGTYRDVEVRRDHPLASTLASLARTRTTERLSLSRLEREHIGQLIREMAEVEPDEQAINDVHAETEGNPFFATEVIRLLTAQGAFDSTNSVEFQGIVIPESVREVIGRSLDRLTDECNETLRMASVIGREFDLSLLQAVSELELDAVLTALDEAIEARMVEERGRPGQYRFAHTLIQETLYDELSSSRRYRMHGLVGETIERLHQNNLTPHYGDLARHFRLAPFGANLEKAVDYAVKAGDRAMEQVAWESAAGHYQRAVEMLETQGDAEPARLCETLLKLGQAQGRAGIGRGQGIGAGNDPRTRSTFQRAATVARDAGLEEPFARAAFGAAGVSLHHTSRGEDLIRLMQDALLRLPDDDSIVRARLLARLSRDACHWSMSDLSSVDPNPWPAGSLASHAYQWSDEAIAMARRLGDPSTLAYTLLARPMMFDEPLDDWFDRELALANETISTSRAASDPVLEAWAIFERHSLLLSLGDVDTARRDIQRFANVIDHLNMPILDWFLCTMRSSDALNSGRYEEAAYLIEQGHEIWPESSTINAQDLMLRRERGQRLGAPRDFFKSDVSPNDPGWVAFYPFVLVALMEEGGRAELDSALEGVDLDVIIAAPRTSSWIRSASLFAEVAAHRGDSEWASRLYDALLPFASLSISTGFHDHCGGSVSYYLGLLASSMDRWEATEEHFALALERNERHGYLPYAACARYARADMLLRRGDPDDRERAMRMAAEAKTTAREIGMVRLLRLIADLEQRAGVRKPSKTGGGGLSPREIDVLRLVVEGKSDREIGEELFISHFTVMRHVSSILRKLDLDSRSAAAVYAVRNELV